ncbi:Na(+)/H(+) antiporter subunit B [Oceanobacillus caeni]|uniref:Monovalent cation/H+ antiporter subunit B n=1 Tax=Oceanobacillus caeni TaxID=405946 RepID=A0ABR5MKX2_9BACI|nr:MULTISPECIES: Na(+)/H(+) antiporter subunit B [Bacillaceae]KKE79290.1 monovalent cation/H+ antiporter subunit B [Bacilli bacterium VT-13-104]PZD86840.1 Na(+)/H(+) antiporter subunit B [Bacilli bacterium]KPH76455.1 monovalent cation/H+ antiporter subunit B [Oceanobacillus caeni]MBU8792263.1 Na(+)/H(+) antiporter subunit B [Oceanobacillus caeni]MCR1833825.1 Na(+)/H(+) antiporter subunit B [Oceanobacillus caeni]
MKTNNVILRAVVKLVVFIILTLAVYLFLSGHHSPGGGFIGGLVVAAALVLLFVSFDIETVRGAIPFDFKKVAALGAFISVTTGFGSLLFGEPFLSQTFAYFDLPFFGETELTTVTIFEAGVALVVVGVVVTIILSIVEDV